MDDGLVDEVVQEFLAEAHDSLDRLDLDLLALEERPSTELLGSIFRAVHSIKGTCGFFGYDLLGSVGHAAENLLSLLRDEHLAVTDEVTAALLSTVDAMRDILLVIAATGSDDEAGDHEELIAELIRLQDGPPPSRPVRLGDLLVEQGLVSAEAVELAVTEQALGDRRPLGEILVALGVIDDATVEAALHAQSEVRGVASAASTVRVDVRLLDELLGLVGELGSVSEDLRRLGPDSARQGLADPVERLERIGSELGQKVMSARMQPIGVLWKRFPRVVRDLARSLSKEVRVEMDGADVEVDKAVVEAIKDPLAHLVRNAVDHGIEDRSARAAAGKPIEGRLWLRAYHETGQVVIEIADDGRGIDARRIRDEAIERGSITRSQGESMTPQELVKLVFLPGLTTTSQVTSLSGRGVGMDVVKTNIARIGGTLDIATAPGRGTTVRVTIPHPKEP
ncbi:MAG: ATP-binding protein [Acidimicrobiales bacterium]|nr:ATP-binding protein [Acidimicrobiales bacterium]